MSHGILDKTDRVLERLSKFFAVLSGILVLLMAFTASYVSSEGISLKAPSPIHMS